MDELEYKGVWWLPDKPEKKVCGILRFTPNEGAILDLIGSFKDIKEMNKRLNPEIILGASSNGKNITLHKCFETESNLSIPGSLTSSFYANEVFVGAHFQKSEDIKFRGLSIRYSYLDEWIGISGFDIQYFDKKEVVIKHKQSEPIQASIGEDCIIFIDILAAMHSVHSIVQKEMSIEQRTYLRVKHPVEKSLDEYWSIIRQIQNFLSLGIAEPVCPLEIIGETEANKEIISVKIYYHLPEISEAFKTIYPHDMLFTFKDISDRFEMLLKNWFEKASTLEPVYDLYFGTLYNPWMYLQHQFLSLIQAVEAYHRRKFEGKYQSDEDYKPTYEKFKKFINGLDVDPSFKEALKSKLKYGNEYSLRKRLKDLFEQYNEVLNGFIEDKNDFINKVVDTRNYLTHYDEDLKDKAVDGEQLYYVTQQLKVLIVICLLSELDFNFKEIKDLIARNRKYKHVFNRKYFR